MRQTSNSKVNGTQLDMDIVIAANFHWLILPISAVTLVLVLLVSVAIQSRRCGVPAWKSKQLETLTVLEPNVREAFMSDQVDAVCTKVRLRKVRDTKWVLEGANPVEAKAKDNSSLELALGPTRLSERDTQATLHLK